ncbi:MAG: heme o synthase [Acidimicrobiales bacterium]|nr:heme o synthase [Acidimicrobiales bacterium]
MGSAAALPHRVGAVLKQSRAPLRTRVAGYVALTKPRIIELLLITTVPTMVVAERGMPSGWLMLNTVIGGTLSAGGANAMNMFIDRDIDRIMQRTKGRPLVTGVMTPRAALTFAIGIEAFSFLYLWYWVNLLSAVLALSACLFYVLVYTLWLKRRSRQNIVIGGAAGAAPVLIGWAAVTGGLGWAPWILFGVMFLWTPPHFWALAIKYKDDYASVDVPMLPSVASLRDTAVQIVGYTVAVWALSIAFWWSADLGAVYLVSAVVLGAAFTWLTIVLLRKPTTRNAMKVFTFSITYVTLLFGAMALDQLISHG